MPEMPSAAPQEALIIVNTSEINKIELGEQGQLSPEARARLDKVFLGAVALRQVIKITTAENTEDNFVLIENSTKSHTLMQLEGNDAIKKYRSELAELAEAEGFEPHNGHLTAINIGAKSINKERINWKNFTLDPDMSIEVIPELKWKRNQLQTAFTTFISNPEGEIEWEFGTQGGTIGYVMKEIVPQLAAIETILDPGERLQMLEDFYSDLAVVSDFMQNVIDENIHTQLSELYTGVGRQFDLLRTNSIVESSNFSSGDDYEQMQIQNSLREIDTISGQVQGIRKTLGSPSLLLYDIKPEYRADDGQEIKSPAEKEKRVKWLIGDTISALQELANYGDGAKFDQAMLDFQYLWQTVASKSEGIGDLISDLNRGEDMNYKIFFYNLLTLVGLERSLPDHQQAARSEVLEIKPEYGLAKGIREGSPVANINGLPTKEDGTLNFEKMAEQSKLALVQDLMGAVGSVSADIERVANNSQKNPARPLPKELINLFVGDEGKGKLYSKLYVAYIILQTLRGEFDWSTSRSDKITEEVGQHRRAALRAMGYSDQEIKALSFLPQLEKGK